MTHPGHRLVPRDRVATVTAMLHGSQLRAARAMLRWTVAELATHSGVSAKTISRAESVDGVPRMLTETMDALQLALEQGGCVFIDANQHTGSGVRLRRP
jgi:DNA-binding XRE family transcriptional regulator